MLKNSFIVLFIFITSSSLVLSWELNKPSKCDFTYYDNKGYGACGSWIDASRQDLAAISWREWKGGNPNHDPLCKICIKITYKGKTIKVPIKDKCPSCAITHVDLSKTAFQKLAPLSVGHVYGATKTFVKC